MGKRLKTTTETVRSPLNHASHSTLIRALRLRLSMSCRSSTTARPSPPSTHARTVPTTRTRVWTTQATLSWATQTAPISASRRWSTPSPRRSGSTLRAWNSSTAFHMTKKYYADHMDPRFDKTQYSLWNKDNSQNAFADNTAADGEALKKMNRNYHDQDYIDGNTRKTISTFAETRSQYTVLKGHEKGKEDVSDSCDRSGKVWRKDWKDKTWQMGSHVSDDANAGWDVDSYTIQHSAGFDSDEAVITHLQDPYVGYSCFDQCDGDLTHVPTGSVTNGVTLTWHNGDEDGAKRGCEGTVLSSGFQTLIPGTYALKYSCEDEAGHVTTKCRTILNEDHTKPIITVLEADQQTYEATRSDNYVDAGATCSDEVDGNISQDVEVSGDVVNLARVGVYTIKYNCQDSAANTADEAARTVVVQDTSCPSCVISDDNTAAADNTDNVV